MHGLASPLVLIDPTCGKLSYGLYASEGQSNAAHLLPDFSFAGYEGGGVAIPDIPTAVTVNPQPGDDYAAIQAALDAVAAMTPDVNGFRGAVLLTAGTYEVSDTLVMAADGVVLRGEGQGSAGTVLVATKAEQHDLIQISNGSGGISEVGGTRVDITSPLVPVGGLSFAVTDASGFTVGDTVVVIRTPNQASLDALDMGQWGWTPSSYEIDFEREITAIVGDTITVDIPIVDAMESQYGGGALALENGVIVRAVHHLAASSRLRPVRAER